MAKIAASSASCFRRRLRWHDLRIESASGRAAFIGFVPKRKLTEWERPFFPGRFCDLSTAAARLHRQAALAAQRGQSVSSLHAQNEGAGSGRRSIGARCCTGARTCGRRGRSIKALRDEYVRHPFATFANERRKPKHGRYMGQLYSSASIAKQYLRLLGIAPLLEKQPRFRAKALGHGRQQRISAAGPTCGCARLMSPCGCWTLQRCTRPSSASSGSTSCLGPREIGIQGRHGRDQGPCSA